MNEATDPTSSLQHVASFGDTPFTNRSSYTAYIVVLLHYCISDDSQMCSMALVWLHWLKGHFVWNIVKSVWNSWKQSSYQLLGCTFSLVNFFEFFVMAEFIGDIPFHAVPHCNGLRKYSWVWSYRLMLEVCD